MDLRIIWIISGMAQSKAKPPNPKELSYQTISLTKNNTCNTCCRENLSILPNQRKKGKFFFRTSRSFLCIIEFDIRQEGACAAKVSFPGSPSLLPESYIPVFQVSNSPGRIYSRPLSLLEKGSCILIWTPQTSLDLRNNSPWTPFTDEAVMLI